MSMTPPVTTRPDFSWTAALRDRPGEYKPALHSQVVVRDPDAPDYKQVGELVEDDPLRQTVTVSFGMEHVMYYRVQIRALHNGERLYVR